MWIEFFVRKLLKRLPSVWLPVSYGEAFDRYIILCLKKDRLGDKFDDSELVQVEKWLKCQGLFAKTLEIPEIVTQTILLSQVNATLWDLEILARRDDPVETIGAVVKEIQACNAKRALIKRSIDLLLNCPFSEVKDYSE